MPILRENRSRYPSNWRDIRTSILERARHRCEFCGVTNHAIGYRNCEGHFQPVKTRHNPLYSPPAVITGPLLSDSVYVHRLFKIVLTIAHLNHQPEDCRPENLKALCQQCHLRYDVDHHTTTRQQRQRVVLEHIGQMRFHFKRDLP